MSRDMILQEQITKLEKDKVNYFKELSNLAKLFKENYFDKGILMTYAELQIMNTFYYDLCKVNYSLEVLYKIKEESKKEN